MEPLLSRNPAPRAPSRPGYIDVLRFGRTPRGRALVLLAGLLIEVAVLLPAAQSGNGGLPGVPGVTAVAVACVVAALRGPVPGGVVAFVAAVEFMLASCDRAVGRWVVLVLRPAEGGLS